ncbi:hypothetical protein [Streptomyces sp. NBC_00029]|uniref:hypothetical protein n=1 Tax=Streptomyces sp. NBC_00029 TaxID=2903613 RepID=UPI00386F41DD
MKSNEAALYSSRGCAPHSTHVEAWLWGRLQLAHRMQVVLLHRSRTGNGTFAATFAPVDGGGWRIDSALVERDVERYRGTNDAYDCVMLELVISAIVLGEPATDLRSKLVELKRRESGSDAPAGVIQHSALGLRSDSQPITPGPLKRRRMQIRLQAIGFAA